MKRTIALLKWINFHSATVFTLGVMVYICAIYHVGVYQMFIGNRVLTDIDSHIARKMAFIRFMHTHSWLAVAYVSFVLGSLLWLEIRRVPRRIVWLTFFLLALPCLSYLRVCVHISSLKLVAIPSATVAAETVISGKEGQ